MSELPLWVTIPASLLLILAGIITVIGSAGLLRLNRFYPRMHAVTLGNTMGVGCIVLATILVASTLSGWLVLRPLLNLALLILVSPITAILLMRAGVRRDPRRPVPEE